MVLLNSQSVAVLYVATASVLVLLIFLCSSSLGTRRENMARLAWIGTAVLMASTAAASEESTRRHRNEIVYGKDHLFMEKVRNTT